MCQLKIWLMVLLIPTACLAGLKSDLNLDGKVDYRDFAIFAEEWLMSGNNYLAFDGSTGFITVPDDATLDFGTGDFSICFVINVSDISTAQCILQKYQSFTALYQIAIGGNTIQIDLISGAAIWSYYASMTGHAGEFTFVAIVKSSSGISFYMNGILVATTQLAKDGDPSLNLTGNFYIGGTYVPDSYLSGSLDDLRIYKGIALTQAQVSTIYNNGNGKKYNAADAGVGLAFDFDEGVGNPVSTGTAALTGTITGGVTWQRGGVPLRYKSLSKQVLLSKYNRRY